MTPLVGLSPDGTLIVRSGEPLSIRLILTDAVGTPENLEGRDFALVLIRPAFTMAFLTIPGVMEDGKESTLLSLSGSNGAATYELGKYKALNFLLQEVTSGEPVTLHGGPVEVAAGPTNDGGDAPDPDAIPISIVTVSAQTVVVNRQGAQGFSAASVLARAGVIEEPTAEAFNAYLVELATSDVAGQAGAAAGAAAANALLATKADKNSPAFTGTPTAPAPASLADKQSDTIVRVADIAKFRANRQGQKALMPPEWAGASVMGGAVDFRNIVPSDMGVGRVGRLGDLALMEYLRLFFLPVEIEGYSMAQSDASLAINTLLQEHDPAGLWFGQPAYQMDSPILPSLLSNIVLASASASIFGPPTMEFINPAQKPFSLGPGNGGVKLEGIWIIEHRTKPAAGFPSVELVGSPWFQAETLVIRNAALALRLMSGRGRIRRLVTDADVAISAAVGIDFAIDEWIKIPGFDKAYKANSISGGASVPIATPGAGLWTPPPTGTFAVPGSLAAPETAPSYASTSATWKRRGSEIKIRGSMTITIPAYTGASGEFRIMGLPFPARAGNERSRIHLSDISGFTWPGSTVTDLFLATEPGQSYLTVSGLKSGGTRSSATTTSFPPGTYTFRFEGTYEAEYGA